MAERAWLLSEHTPDCSVLPTQRCTDLQRPRDSLTNRSKMRLQGVQPHIGKSGVLICLVSASSTDSFSCQLKPLSSFSLSFPVQ